MTSFTQQYEHDRTIWENCADTYERQIVRGHPDVTGYEAFEHSFIDRLAVHLIRDCGKNIHCYDFGCGSGRIHTLLAPMLFSASSPFPKNSDGNTGHLVHVGGIDFSEQMIQLAHQNLSEHGLQHLCPDFLSFDIGSAFNVPSYKGDATPFAVSVCNSIGVMQGPEGAKKLFSVMGRFVRERKGIALISCYQCEAVEDFALSNYESTMDVCGQPVWLTPRIQLPSSDSTPVPRCYKRAYSREEDIIVDIYDHENKPVKKNVSLTRDPERVRNVIATGEIDSFNGYHSHWYSTSQVKEWMNTYWNDGALWHISGGTLDRLRGEPAQLALVDYSGGFSSLASRWGLSPLN